jgi:hypothetical protein
MIWLMDCRSGGTLRVSLAVVLGIALRRHVVCLGIHVGDTAGSV